MVAPPGNQAANGENKLQPEATGGPGLLDKANLYFSHLKSMMGKGEVFCALTVFLQKPRVFQRVAQKIVHEWVLSVHFCTPFPSSELAP